VGQYRLFTNLAYRARLLFGFFTIKFIKKYILKRRRIFQSAEDSVLFLLTTNQQRTQKEKHYVRVAQGF